MTIASDADLTGVRRAGRVVARTLEAMRRAVRPGITTGELDALAERVAAGLGARSAPRLTYGFPGFTCISVNDEIIHGIPGPRALAPGDVVKLDVSLELDGFFADAAVTALVPPASAQARHLLRCARNAFDRALAVARAGRRVWEIGRAVESTARRAGFSVPRELTGHGVGRRLHEPPTVPNFADPAARGVLGDGLVIALEPLLTACPARVVQGSDGWTLSTHDRSLAVHHEHTIVIRHGAPLVLTAA